MHFRSRAFLLCRMQAVFLIQFPVKLLQFYFQMLPQVFRQLCDVPTVQEFIGWFPVWVGTSDQIRV